MSQAGFHAYEYRRTHTHHTQLFRIISINHCLCQFLNSNFMHSHLYGHLGLPLFSQKLLYLWTTRFCNNMWMIFANKPILCRALQLTLMQRAMIRSISSHLIGIFGKKYVICSIIELMPLRIDFQNIINCVNPTENRFRCKIEIVMVGGMKIY